MIGDLDPIDVGHFAEGPVSGIGRAVTAIVTARVNSIALPVGWYRLSVESNVMRVRGPTSALLAGAVSNAADQRIGANGTWEFYSDGTAARGFLGIIRDAASGDATGTVAGIEPKTAAQPAGAWG
ncbi:MAG: hypothetical protein ABII82_01975 [Verrucomicrobiota bacterium]